MTERQDSETDGLFVFSCLCVSSKTTLVRTLSAEGVYIVCGKNHIHCCEDICTTWTVLSRHSGAASHFSLLVVVFQGNRWGHFFGSF